MVTQNIAGKEGGSTGYNHSGIRINAIGTTNCSDTKIYNNLIINANDPGSGKYHAAISVTQVQNSEMKNLKIFNNITYDNYNMDAEFWYTWTSSTGKEIRNNCFYRKFDDSIIYAVGDLFDAHDLNYKKGYASDNINSDPLLEIKSGVTGKYYAIKDGSPCIDKGINVNIITDFSGNSIEDVVDIGPVEYQGSVEYQKPDQAIPLSPPEGLKILTIN